ncbi:hypothetical protein AGRA3207_005916 [Actinomadura graeca]|uniref:Integral membrane protein n=1 Tax=Actinomadura graeca TaxID=2750812 RepID=A0ABX8R4C3_9ACTN|nr:hypothetical protein [Actinomadura graeca]QXJ24567.1 hypothetical protein AGRA3207_005916 [Actinomadura graeca]
MTGAARISAWPGLPRHKRHRLREPWFAGRSPASIDWYLARPSPARLAAAGVSVALGAWAVAAGGLPEVVEAAACTALMVPAIGALFVAVGAVSLRLGSRRRARGLAPGVYLRPDDLEGPAQEALGRIQRATDVILASSVLYSPRMSAVLRHVPLLDYEWEFAKALYRGGGGPAGRPGILAELAEPVASLEWFAERVVAADGAFMRVSSGEPAGPVPWDDLVNGAVNAAMAFQYVAASHDWGAPPESGDRWDGPGGGAGSRPENPAALRVGVGVLRALAIGIGLVWAPSVVLTHRLDGPAWWRVLLAIIGLGAAAPMLGVGMRLAFRGRRAGEEVLHLAGLVLAGTLFGTIVAFVAAPFAGQPWLMPSAAALAMICMMASAAVGYGVSSLSLTMGGATLSLGVPTSVEQLAEGWREASIGTGASRGGPGG